MRFTEHYVLLVLLLFVVVVVFFFFFFHNNIYTFFFLRADGLSLGRSKSGKKHSCFPSALQLTSLVYSFSTANYNVSATNTTTVPMRLALHFVTISWLNKVVHGDTFFLLKNIKSFTCYSTPSGQGTICF